MKKIQEILGWCLVLNAVLFFVTVIIILIAQDVIYQIYDHLYNLSSESSKMVVMGYLGLWKALVIVFVAVPYFALRIVGTKKDE